jgi:NAD(P)H-nitrite reductase large subunit
VVDSLRSLVGDKLKQTVIRGNSEDTLYNVIKIIRNFKLKTKVLPLQTKQNRKIIRIFGMKEEELDTIKNEYENPGNYIMCPRYCHELRSVSVYPRQEISICLPQLQKRCD